MDNKTFYLVCQRIQVMTFTPADGRYSGINKWYHFTQPIDHSSSYSEAEKKLNKLRKEHDFFTADGKYEYKSGMGSTIKKENLSIFTIETVEEPENVLEALQ